MTLSLAQQIAEVEREIGKRRQAYPRLVSQGHMRRAEADYAIAAMSAVRETLVALEKNGLASAVTEGGAS